MLLGFTGPRGERKRRGSLLFCLSFFAASSFGSTLYATSASTSNSGDTYWVGYLATDEFSSTIDYDYLGDGQDDAAFTLQLALPDTPGYNLTSAPLDFSASDTPSLTSCYDCFADALEDDCGFFGNEECAYTGATLYYEDNVSFAVTQISDPSYTWSGDLTGPSIDVDLASLGFGNDLLSGGTLTISGYMYVYGDWTGIESAGSNDYSYLESYLSASGDESASLTLDGVSPEPSSFLLLGSALIGAGLFRKNLRGGTR